MNSDLQQTPSTLGKTVLKEYCEALAFGSHWLVWLIVNEGLPGPLPTLPCPHPAVSVSLRGRPALDWGAAFWRQAVGGDVCGLATRVSSPVKREK